MPPVPPTPIMQTSALGKAISYLLAGMHHVIFLDPHIFFGEVNITFLFICVTAEYDSWMSQKLPADLVPVPSVNGVAEHSLAYMGTESDEEGPGIGDVLLSLIRISVHVGQYI